MAIWSDIFKLFTYAFTEDPISQKDHGTPQGAGITQPDAMPDIRGNSDGMGGGGGGSVRLRDTNDFVDLSTVTNRMHRYKEYQRLQSMAEIDMAMTVFADESCLGGNTLVTAPAYEGGYLTLEWLAENMKDQRFLTYAYDFDKDDITLAWAYDPRVVKEVETVKVLLDNGTEFVATIDHEILTKDGKMKAVGKLRMGDELKPFYRIIPNQWLTEQKYNQHPRILTNSKGWITERQFVDEWKFGKDLPKYAKVNRYCQMMAAGLTLEKIESIVGITVMTIRANIEKAGWSNKEMKWLADRPKHRRIIGIMPNGVQKVYDLSVEKHQNFCTNWGMVHNCQKDENGRVFEITCENKEVKDELEFLLFHRKMLNFDQKKTWNRFKNLFINGDDFWEIVVDPENPKGGIVDVQFLPPDSMYRIESTKGKLIEFQQSKEGPDYQSLSRVDVTASTEADLQQSTAIRFAPQQIIHVKIGDERKTFYPYGVSLIEAARGPAHQLRLIEDAMVVYRLCVTGYTRVRTGSSWKYMKDMEVGDEVFSFNDCGVLFPSKVIWTVNNGIKDVYRVRSQHNEITGTATHPILVERDEVIQYVDIQNLIPKRDKLINATRDEEIPVPIPRILTEKGARLSNDQLSLFRSEKRTYGSVVGLIRDNRMIEGRVKQFLYTSGKSLPYDEAEKACNIFGLDPSKMVVCDKHEIRPELINLPDFVDEDFARLFGFLIGDGSIRAKGVGFMNQLHFTSSPDEQLNQQYASLLKRYFGKYRFSKDKRSKCGIGNYTVDSRFACRLFVTMGFIPGCRNKRIPSWVYTAPKAIRRAFIEGISDADGCERYTKAGLWFSTIELCNKLLVEDIKEVWHSIGLCSGHIKTRKRKGGHEIEPGRMMKPTEAHSVTITDRILPKYEKVWKVEYLGEENVYDVTVDNDFHNIVSNGIVVHQTRAPERRIFYIDVQQLPPAKAEAFIERMKDQLKKKKMPKNSSPEGASSVEERWHAPAADEDFWIPIRPNANTRVETLPGACLALDTKIPLLDGRTLTLQEIIGEYESGKQLWAYSCCPNTGRTAPGLISWAGVTRKNTQVVKVTLDNGESIICTPDHKFPVQGLGKIEAKDLPVGCSLFPFMTKFSPMHGHWKTNYEHVYDSSTRDWVATHRMVAKAVKGTHFEQNFEYLPEFKGQKKNVIHHINVDKRNNTPENLTWMQYRDHKRWHLDNQEVTNQNISKALVCYHENLDENKKKEVYASLIEKGIKGNKATQEKLKDKKFNQEFRNKQRQGWKKAKIERFSIHKKRGKKISTRNKEYWSNLENKKKAFDKQKIVYPDALWEDFVFCIKNGDKVSSFLEKINQSAEVINSLIDSNLHLKRDGIDLTQGLNTAHIDRMIRMRGFRSVSQVHNGIEYENTKGSNNEEVNVLWPEIIWNYVLEAITNGWTLTKIVNCLNEDVNMITCFSQANCHNFGKKFRFHGKFTIFYVKQLIQSKGYTDYQHLKKEALNYNHKVVSVEYLIDPIDTGTLTIDNNHDVHNYHTFALRTCGVYTCNSNLGEIDDCIYFRNKLFISLNFPKNYLNNEDAQTNQKSLSSQDIKFARMIMRLQSHMEDAFWDLCDRHLRLRGFPEESYEDLEIKMTPPSDIHEMMKMELLSGRIQNAGSLKGAMIMSKFDILTKFMKYSEEEAKLMIARLKIEQLEELKLQIIAQNPSLMGVGLPPDDEQQVGSEPTPDNPMMGGGPEDPMGEMPPGMDGGDPMGGSPMPASPAPKNSRGGAMVAFPDPQEEDIHKYDLEIRDFASEMDGEEHDASEDS